MSFWNGFLKQADILTKFDAQGGTAPRTPEEQATAQEADLLTLPKNVEGANCTNCRFWKHLENGQGVCQQMMLETTDRMVCGMWDAPGALRNYEMQDAAEVPEQEDPNAVEMLQPELADPPVGPDGKPLAEESQQPVGEGQPEQMEPPTPKEKAPKQDSGGKHTININVGDKKAQQEKKAAFFGIYQGLGRR